MAHSCCGFPNTSNLIRSGTFVNISRDIDDQRYLGDRDHRTVTRSVQSTIPRGHGWTGPCLCVSVPVLAIVASAFLVSSAFAQSACETQAVGKDGKPLSGAAKTAFVKKCKKDAREPNAVGSDGKPLSGAAKNSFMNKCQTDA